MGSYLDRLSAQASDDNPDELSNEHLIELNDLLFGDEDFVILTMNWRNTGVFNTEAARRCIMRLFKHNRGFADIIDCCGVFVSALDDVVAVQDKLMPLINELREKYGEL